LPKKDVLKHLAELIETMRLANCVSSGNLSRIVISRYDKRGKPTSQIHVDQWDKSVEDVQIACKRFLSFPIEGVIADAFDAAKLDPKDPFHWYKLVQIFSLAHFKREGGAPKKRSSKEYWEIVRHFNELKAAELKRTGRSPKKKPIFELMAKSGRYRTKNGNLSADRIGKLYNEAFDPRYNDLVSALDTDGKFPEPKSQSTVGRC
jgi:hypothetical protein